MQKVVRRTMAYFNFLVTGTLIESGDSLKGKNANVKRRDYGSSHLSEI